MSQSISDHNIYHDLVISASISEVFEAITEPDHLNNWWPKSSSGVPEMGAEYNFHFSSEYNWFGKVAHYELGKSFFIKMTKADADWNPTTFGFELEEEKGGALVKFQHTGWPSCNEHFRRSSYCWAILLKGLKDYVEKGSIVPFQDRE
ncbi:SRPBCC family protein [Fulvivirga ligni]|uniref:SRPBCC family protein n=1 Tax=Fulvivirga ligni TaxID=2904246 RepID=UPI001F387834|nr:SRPBCC domain-containing protein [Fulvivirga ligni]UII22116.1 SRPBCC domain-containing protein [Fulvivirga ligni]